MAETAQPKELQSEKIEGIGCTKINETKPSIEAHYNLSNFHLECILNNNTRNKTIALLGRFPKISHSDKAIVIFEKQAFVESDVSTDHSGRDTNDDRMEKGNGSKPSYFCDDLQVRTEFINHIYGNFYCVPPPRMDGLKAMVIYPATEKHIAKYSMCQKYVIKETPELYQEITLPYLNSSQLSLEWVYNILNHKQETERIIYEDRNPETGYVLLPDLKWDGHTLETLYLLVLTHKCDIKSLRDLNASHLPLLNNIRSGCAEVIEKRYGLLASQLRMYFHYQPTFYHLHVHINPLRNEAPGIWCEKSHMLDTVINNLELMDDYYKKATLPCVLYEGNELLSLFDDKIRVRKAPKHMLENKTEGTDGVKREKTEIGSPEKVSLKKKLME